MINAATTANHFVAFIQTTKTVQYRKVSAARAAKIMAAPHGAPGLGNVLALYRSTDAYHAANESVFRARAGYLPRVWEWNNVGVNG